MLKCEILVSGTPLRWKTRNVPNEHLKFVIIEKQVQRDIGQTTELSRRLIFQSTI